MSKSADAAAAALDPREFQAMRRFYLHRKHDASGVSGTGIVAAGVAFPEPNGRVLLGWLTDTNSVAVYDSTQDLRDIHGHDGGTDLVFFDEDRYPEPEQQLVDALWNEWRAARHKRGYYTNDDPDRTAAKFHAGRASGLSTALDVLTDGEEVPERV